MRKEAYDTYIKLGRCSRGTVKDVTLVTYPIHIIILLRVYILLLSARDTVVDNAPFS